MKTSKATLKFVKELLGSVKDFTPDEYSGIRKIKSTLMKQWDDGKITLRALDEMLSGIE